MRYSFKTCLLNPSPTCWQYVVFWLLTFTKTPKKSSELSSCTLLDTVFLSLQCDACFWTSCVDSPKLGPHSASKHSQMSMTKEKKKHLFDREKHTVGADRDMKGRNYCKDNSNSNAFTQSEIWHNQPHRHCNTTTALLETNRISCYLFFLCQRQTLVEKVLTQWSGQQSVDNDVGVAPDGRCEVSVEGDVEGVVLK